MEFQWDFPDAMIGIGISIHNVEIFAPDEIPNNIDPEDLPRLLRPARAATEPQARPGPPPQPEFRHDDDYSHVWLREREFCLTVLQAKIVKVVHDAFLSGGSPWMKLDEIREKVTFESETLHQIFRRMPDWNDLILSDRRGAYRLNING